MLLFKESLSQEFKISAKAVFSTTPKINISIQSVRVGSYPKFSGKVELG